VGSLAVGWRLRSHFSDGAGRSADVDDGAHFNGRGVAGAEEAAGDGDGVVEVVGFDEGVALPSRKRTVVAVVVA
jgi:hypothetical protein